MARIAFVSTMAASPWGGSEELWSLAATHLLESGHDVGASVLDWGTMPSRLEALQSAGALLHRRPRRLTLSPKPLLSRLRHGDWNVGAIDWLSRFRPDLVVISQGGALDGASLMNRCRARGWRYASIAQANFEGWWPDDVAAEAGASAYRGAQRVFFVSHRNLRLLEAQLAIRLHNAEVVHNPFQVSHDTCLDDPATSGTARLACVGRLEPQAKGQDIIFDVLSQPAWRSRSLELRLYGNGASARSLQRLAGLLDLRCVSFKGHVEDIVELWKNNDILILPSRYEGTPLVLVEAMLCGRPSVVTDVGGNAELIEDGRSGFVAPAATPAAFSEAMERAWTQRADWPALGQAARERARSTIPRNPARDFAARLAAIAA